MKTNYKVLHLIGHLDIGGTEKQLALVLPHLSAEIHSEVICLFGRGVIGSLLESQGIKVHYLAGSGYFDPRVGVRLWRMVRKIHPDILVTYLIYADIIGRFIGRLGGVRIIISSQRSRLFGPAYWRYLDRYTRWSVSHYTAQTKATKQILTTALHIPASRITVIPNAVAVSVSSRSTLREQLAITSKDIVLICVANLKPEKGLGLLIQAFERVFAQQSDMHLWLVGEGPERESLAARLARSPAKEHIHLLGLRQDVPALLAAADIFVLPTYSEGMSNALLEAMHLGLACVTSDIEVNKEMIYHGNTGLLFKTGDVQSLAEQLQDLINDKIARQKLGTAAAMYTRQRHGVHTVAKLWQQLFTMHSQES